MAFLDLLGEVLESPVNTTANRSSPPSAHGKKRKIKEIEEAGKKKGRNSSSSDTTAPVAPGDGI